MCRTIVVLAMVALYAGMAHSWDIAVSVGDRLEFCTNGTKTYTVHLESHNLTAIAYDEVHNMMLFVDKQSDNDAICGYNLGSLDTRCFIKRFGSNIQDLAFDPATELLFFTDTKEGSINWISLKDQESKDNVYGNLLIKIDEPSVKNIAVDSCRGYIYWTNAHEGTQENIMERARFDGSEREVVYKWLPVYSFAIDPKTHEYYYIEGVEWLKSSYYRKADLRKKNLQADISEFILYHNYDTLPFSAPKELTVSNYYLYWMNSNMSYTTVWQFPKNAQHYEEPKNIIRFFNERPMGIAANYRITEQVQGLQDCEALSSLIPTVTAIDNSPNIEQNKQKQQTEFKLICVHGIKVSETSVCKCRPGYTGERCDVPACENYCLQGNCTYNDEGLPKCRCNSGYSGERCEINVCHGYCLNDGDCSLNEESEPICQCEGNYEGYRCQESGCFNYCFQGSCNFTDEGHPVCSCNSGYEGERCEFSVCHSYCLNNGECLLNEEDEPVCECVGNTEGTRCEVVKNEKLSNPTLTQYFSEKRNLTLASLLSNWRKLTANISFVIEV